MIEEALAVSVSSVIELALTDPFVPIRCIGGDREGTGCVCVRGSAIHLRYFLFAQIASATTNQYTIVVLHVLSSFLD
jgi:hypothetical protein